MFKIPIPFLFKAPFDKQTLENVFLGLDEQEDESSVCDDDDDDEEEEELSRSSNSSSKETDSRFMDEKGTSFIALHPHQRVSVVNPGFLPKHILDKGHNDDISQISLDFGDVSSIESSVRLNPYGASSEQMEIAMRWRKNIAAAQKHDSESCNPYNEGAKKPIIQKEKRYESAKSHSSFSKEGKTRLLVPSDRSRDISSFHDTYSNNDCYPRQLHETSYSSPPPPPPPLPKHKKKFSESQFQISPPPIRSKSIGDSYKRLRRPSDEATTIDSVNRSTSMEKHAPRNAKNIKSNSYLDSVNQLKIKMSSQHEEHKEEQKKDIDQTLPISDSDDDSLDHIFRVEQVKRRSDAFKSLFEPFDDNVSIEGFSLTYSDSVLGSLQTAEGKKDECIVIYEKDLQDMERAAVIVQSIYRGWSCRYRMLWDIGIAKRRHWQIREKSHSITKIHSSIRRDARKLLRIQSTSSMIVAVRIVCAKRIQRWWRNESIVLTHRRETGFDVSLLPKDWYENMKLTDVGIPFFKDDFEAIVGINTSKFTKTASPRSPADFDKAFAFDTEYYQQANQNVYEDDAADDVLEVHENSQFIASLSLLPKFFNGIVGRFVKIFRKNKQQKYQEGKKICKKEKRVLKLFKRSKRKNNQNPSSNDMNSETSLPDPNSMYESLEDETPGVAWTASFESVPFDEI